MSKKLLPGENPTSFKITLHKDWWKESDIIIPSLTENQLQEYIHKVFSPRCEHIEGDKYKFTGTDEEWKEAMDVMDRIYEINEQKKDTKGYVQDVPPQG
jgi:hypothetical protein